MCPPKITQRNYKKWSSIFIPRYVTPVLQMFKQEIQRAEWNAVLSTHSVDEAYTILFSNLLTFTKGFLNIKHTGHQKALAHHRWLEKF